MSGYFSFTRARSSAPPISGIFSSLTITATLSLSSRTRASRADAAVRMRRVSRRSRVGGAAAAPDFPIVRRSALRMFASSSTKTIVRWGMTDPPRWDDGLRGGGDWPGAEGAGGYFSK